MIYTSYFARLKYVVNPISISGRAPDWFNGPQYKQLAPKYSFFKDYKDGKIDSKEYTILYKKEVLDKLNVSDVYTDLYHKYDSANFTLLCYEKIGYFCHRQLVAEWLTENGFPTEELFLY